MLNRKSAGTILFLLFVSAAFVCAGIAVIPYPGLQNDEVFFAPPIFTPETAYYSVTVGVLRIPLMVMSYTGALKTWIYAAIFSAWKPSPWTVRIPVLIACLVTIWLTWIWTRQLGGTRAAIAATLLLATDSMFLLTGVFDWGPVALQHVLLMAGLVAVTGFVRSRSLSALAFGFFCWGLGLWDKALMIWLLLGLAIAAVCVFLFPWRRHMRGRGEDRVGDNLSRIKVGVGSALQALGTKVAEAGDSRAVFLAASGPAAQDESWAHLVRCILVGLVAFVAGAAPLIWYNIDRHGETATANANFSRDDYGQKLDALIRTLNGSMLFGYMVADPAPTPTRPPAGAVERLSFAIRRITGLRRTNLLLIAFFMSIAALFWLRNSSHFRAMLFVLIAMAVAWAQMLIIHGTGGSAHHVVLVWPLPFVFTGLALAAITERMRNHGAAVFTAVLSLLVLANLANENEYLARFAIRGGIGVWTDALYPLSSTIDTTKWIGAVDWGYLNGLRVLHQGRIKLFTPAADASESEMKRMVTIPGLLYVQHTPGNEIIPQVNEKFRGRATDLGYSEHVDRLVSDSSGAPVFEIFHFEPVQRSAQLR